MPTPPDVTDLKWPASLDDDTTLFGDPVNIATWTVNGAISNVASEVVVNDPNDILSDCEAPFFIRFATGEICYVEAINAGTDTLSSLTRAVDSSAQAHDDGEVVRMIPTAQYFVQYKGAILALQTELGTDPAGSKTNLTERLAVALDDDGTLKLSAITEHTGIANDNIVEVDGSPNAAEIAVWTANGIDGKTYAELIALLRTAGVIGIDDDDLLEVDGTIEANDIIQATANGLKGLTYAEHKALAGYMTDLADDTTPTAGGDLDMDDHKVENMEQAYYKDCYNHGNQSGAFNIYWGYGNFQKVRMTGDIAPAMAGDPSGPCTLHLYLIGDGTARTPDLDIDADVEWLTDGEPGAYGSTDGEVVGIATFIFDPNLTPKYIVAAAART